VLLYASVKFTSWLGKIVGTVAIGPSAVCWTNIWRPKTGSKITSFVNGSESVVGGLELGKIEPRNGFVSDSWD